MMDMLGQAVNTVNDIGLGVGVGGVGVGGLIYWMIRREVKKTLDHVDNDDIHIRPGVCLKEHVETREDFIRIHARIDDITRAHQDALLNIVRVQQEGNRAIVEAILQRRD